MRISKSREIEDKVRELLRQGWVMWRGSKHLRIQHPNGFQTIVPGSPSDHRAVQNFYAEIKRAERNDFRRQLSPGEKQRGFVLSIYIMLPLAMLLMLAVFSFTLGSYVEFTL